MTYERLTLRYAIISTLFLGLAGIEGLLMRVQLLNIPLLNLEHYYAMLTVHPFVGIYGWAYLAVIGAFYYLIPKLLNKPLYSLKLAEINLWIFVAGVLIVWSSGILTKFASLYTLYWPLPVERFPPGSIAFFSSGLLLIELSVLLFIFNIFGTIFMRRGTSPGITLRSLLISAFGLGSLARRFGVIFSKVGIKSLRRLPNGGGGASASAQPLPVFVVAVMRGSVDAVLNALVLAGAGFLLLVFSLPALLAGIRLDPFIVDPLIYKNVFWWGLDMIADGDVLIWVAGALYLLAPLLTNRKLYAEDVVRKVILADLLISMGVWSHHLMSDTPQPSIMRLISGQFITWGEFFTMGLTFFAVLMTVWLARPVKLTMPIKFMLGGILGFMLGGGSGLLQANYALNLIMHNTQWIPGFHIHQMVLVGLGGIIFAVIYALLPMLTGTELKSQKLSNLHFWLWMIGGVGMAFSMGLAWTPGMLRRTLYPDTGIYLPYMSSAMFFGILLAVGFLAFLINLLHTYGLRTLVGLFIPQRKPKP